MGSLGFDELMVVVVIAIIVFGKDLPSVARKVGQWYSKVKRHVSDLKDELQRQAPDLDAPIDEQKTYEPPPGSTPSAALPGPEPGDPEYKGQDKEAGQNSQLPTPSSQSQPPAAPFDPAKPPEGNGNGATPEAAEPAETKPPDPPAPAPPAG